MTPIRTDDSPLVNASASNIVPGQPDITFGGTAWIAGIGVRIQDEHHFISVVCQNSISCGITR